MVSVHLKSLSMWCVLMFHHSTIQLCVLLFPIAPIKVFMMILINFFVLLSVYLINAEAQWTHGFILFRKYSCFKQQVSLQSIVVFPNHSNSNRIIVKEAYFIIWFPFPCIRSCYHFSEIRNVPFRKSVSHLIN